MANVPSTTEKKDLSTLSKEDLVERIRQLEFHVNQLKNVIAKGNGTKVKKGKPSKQRPFDWSKQHKRHVALKISYLGWDYKGFVVQEDSNETIEHILFDALVTSRLIESRETSNYHRCGRTDKGVSAFCQVISIDLRSTQTSGTGVIPAEDPGCDMASDKPEFEYAAILNRILPAEIRVLAWAPVPPDFSARFDCNLRTYNYFFPRGDLDIDIMNQAAAKLEGTHDFRNLCKMDVGNGVVDFTRSIESAQVIEETLAEGYSMCKLVIKSKAFLWHQIRCIMAVLVMVGKGLESVEVVDELFDVQMNPCKPQYTMASQLPLNLFECHYDGLQWFYDKESTSKVISHYQRQWAEVSVKATMLKTMIANLSGEIDSPQLLHQADFLLPDYRRSCDHRPLMSRITCSSLEERKEYYAKRRKLDKILSEEEPSKE